MSDNLLVKFTGNADAFSATQAITFDDGRPPLVRNGVEGEITAEEYAHLSGRGVVLELLGDGLDSLTVAELRDRLDQAGVDHSGLRKKDDLVDALRKSQSSGEIPLPAAVEASLATGGPASGTQGAGVGGVTGAGSLGVGQTGTSGTTGGGAA